MLMAGSSEQPASSGCLQELTLCLGASNCHEYGSPPLLLQFEVIGCRTDAQMVSTGVGKMNLQGPEARMRLEEQRRAMEWEARDQSNHSGEEEEAGAKMHKQETRYNNTVTDERLSCCFGLKKKKGWST